jgi:uncharacterized membrane protein YesL
MSGFFSLEGPFYKYGSMLADIMILSLVWLVCSIPLVTIGASTSALFYVTTRRIANREGYILRDFWKGFKTNFKRATVIWLLLVLLVLILVFNILNIGVVGNMAVFMLPLQICFLIEAALISTYLFPLTARFDMGVKQTLKSAFFMANRHLPTSITCVVLGLASFLAIYLFPIYIMVAMGVYAWLASYMIIRIFKKYRPEMDKDPAQEIAEIEAAMNAEKNTFDEYQKTETARIEAGEWRQTEAFSEEPTDGPDERA